MQNESYLEEVKGFFSFLTKIFHNVYFFSFRSLNSNNKRYCLHSMPKVSNKTDFQKKNI